MHSNSHKSGATGRITISNCYGLHLEILRLQGMQDTFLL